MARNNYSLIDILKEMSMTKDPNKFEYDFHEYEYKKEYMKLEREWENMLNTIDIKFIEKYVRKKKLENLKKK